MTIDFLKTPTMALGTWAWGDSGEAGQGYFGSSFTRRGLDEVAEKAHAAGFTLWDTAVVYGMGRAETVLGEVLKRHARSDYQLSTKFTPQVAGHGADPVADMLEQSLARLGTNYVDLYWIHNPADVARWTPRLIPLLESGKVRHVGVSNHDLRDIELADRILGEAGHRVEAVQNHYSLLHRDAERAGILDYCHQRGIPFFAYMVLEQGALGGAYGAHRRMPPGTDRAKHYDELLPRLQALTDGLAEVGRQHGASAPEVAMAWALARGASPIIGVTRPGYVDSLVRACRITLADHEVSSLEQLADAAGVDTRGWWEKAM